MTAREQIVSSLPSGAGSAVPEAHQDPREMSDLEARFRATAELLGVCFLPDLRQLENALVFADEDAKPFLEGSLFRFTKDPWEAEVGVTLADGAVAETGSLLLSAGPGRHRLASLAPPIHLAVLRRNLIVASLEDAIRLLPARTSVLVTGPSRTADIEGVLVRGVHGPREVCVLLVD